MFGDLQRSRRIAYTAAFIGLITLGGWISIPFVPAPFTLQTFFVLLSAAVMKREVCYPGYVICSTWCARPAGLSQRCCRLWCSSRAYRGVPDRVYPAAFIAGIAWESDSAIRRIAGLFSAAVFILLCGVAWLIVSSGMSLVPAIILGMAIFVPGEVAKAGAVYVIGRQLP